MASSLPVVYEPWRKSRSMSLLQSSSFPNFERTRTLLELIQSVGRIWDEYQRPSGAGLRNDIITTTLLRVLPKHKSLSSTSSDGSKLWAFKWRLQPTLPVGSMQSWALWRVIERQLVVARNPSLFNYRCKTDKPTIRAAFKPWPRSSTTSSIWRTRLCFWPSFNLWQSWRQRTKLPAMWR